MSKEFLHEVVREREMSAIMQRALAPDVELRYFSSLANDGYVRYESYDEFITRMQLRYPLTRIGRFKKWVKSFFTRW